MSEAFYDLSAVSIGGDEIPMSSFRGNVVLVVNTASKCGFTPQYAGLQQLHEEYASKGLVVLGFPCNQFGRQEPGGDAQIAEGCRVNYGVTFRMFSKIDVNGKQAHPIYKYLRKQSGGAFGGRIPWNFTKFLVDRDGNVVKRYSPTTAPEALRAEIEQALSAPDRP